MTATGTSNGPRLLSQVLWCVLPVAALILLAIWFTVAFVSDRVDQAEASVKLATRAKDQAQTAIERFENLVTTISDLANNDLVVNGLIDPNAEESYLKPFFRSFAIEGFSDVPVLLTDYRGRPITGKYITNWSIADLTRWNRHVAEGSPILALHEQWLVVAVPVYISNLVEGMLVVKLAPQQLDQLLEPVVGDGTIDIVLSNADTPDQVQAAEPTTQSSLTAQAKLPLPHSHDLMLVSTLYQDEAIGPPGYFQWFMLVAFVLDLIALCIGILAAVLLVTKPLNHFIHQLDKARHYTEPTFFEANQGPSEIRHLGEAFNQFVEAERELLQEQSALAEKLATALNREKELNGLQRQFISLVTHEFRTPLAIIDGSAHRIARKLGNVESDHLMSFIQKIRNSVTRLTDLMESVLSVAKLDEGKINFEPVACDIGEMIVEMCSDYQQINTKHQLIAKVDRLPGAAMADVKLLRQVFSNLISNAVKYSSEGTTVYIEGWQSGDELIIAVRDQGFGIPEVEVGRLFDRFFRASTSTGISGTGIGLHLVKHVTELHGGRVEVASTLNVGTTFSVYLPVRQNEASGSTEQGKAA